MWGCMGAVIVEDNITRAVLALCPLPPFPFSKKQQRTLQAATSDMKWPYHSIFLMAEYSIACWTAC